ncbi:MAG: VanZ family protein [Magnetococcales bacterium]|nr:VanZ family protein [Magnetococcales bacterium]
MTLPNTFRQHPRLWIGIALYLGLIYLTLPLTPVAVHYFFAVIGPETFGWGVNTVLILALLGAFYRLYQMNSSLREKAPSVFPLLLPTLAILVIAATVDKPVERIHFLQYAILGVLVFRTLERHGFRDLMVALLWLFLAGLTDEIIQWFLPTRYWDIRDVAMNTLGGGLGLWWGRFLFPVGDIKVQAETRQ